MEENFIRLNWIYALNAVENGAELSCDIDWSFSNQDLIVLGFLHEANLYREKIEDLLEDCNFHTECMLLCEQEYDEYRALMIENNT